MPQTRPSRPAVAAALIAGIGLVAAVAISTPRRSGPELTAPGNHATVSAADSANGPVAMGNGVFMGGAIRHDTSRALRSIPGHPVRALPAGDGQGAEDGGPDRTRPHAVDTVVQSTLASPAMPGTSKNFDGIGFPGVSCNCAPPDTNGEVGLSQYVQIVNEGYQVWDKSTGNVLLGPVGISTIWSGFGGVCQTNGSGDPVVLYDQLANRWLVSQFAGVSTPTDECIAISTTSDATGAYYRYDFHLGTNFYDYPHLAVWPDGYYMSDNVFNSAGTTYLGPQPFVFDRARMLQGLSATFQTVGALGSFVDPFLPADLDGPTLPPAGAPADFVKWPGNGTYQTYHYHADWVTPGNSTFTSFASPAAAGFSQLCPFSRACVPQLGQASSSNLDALADRLMFRLTYRNFGDHESVVGNFTVSSGGVAGIRWFELRNVTNGPETVYQQSTYQPDATWRWMGSAAMDGTGNLAIGFNASSSAIYPQLRYAGRLAGDPLNTLAQGEATLFAGAGSQSGTSNRWGDYADLTVDPVDDCTFWFTSEYYSTNASFSWRTRVGAFTMPGCGSSPTTGSIAGRVTDSVSLGGIPGATVSLSTGPSATTDASGAYSFTGLAPASYDVSASKAGYTPKTNTGVAVTAGATTTSDFALVPIPSTTVGPTYPTTSTAGSGGDGNGFETNRAALWGGPDGSAARDVNSGTSNSTSCTSAARDREVTSGYAFGSLGSSILGIQVELRGFVSSTKSGPRFCVQLSGDGGATWTAGKSTASLGTTLATYHLGSVSDTWARTWTADQLSSTNFRVRIIDLANSTSRTFSLDAIGVSITSR